MPMIFEYERYMTFNDIFLLYLHTNLCILGTCHMTLYKIIDRFLKLVPIVEEKNWKNCIKCIHIHVSYTYGYTRLNTICNLYLTFNDADRCHYTHTFQCTKAIYNILFIQVPLYLCIHKPKPYKCMYVFNFRATFILYYSFFNIFYYNHEKLILSTHQFSNLSSSWVWYYNAYEIVVSYTPDFKYVSS